MFLDGLKCRIGLIRKVAGLEFRSRRCRIAAVFDQNFLLASVFWGAIATGYLVYGFRQKAIVPTLGGVLMMTASYFAGTALVMSVVCVAFILVVYYLNKQGY